MDKDNLIEETKQHIKNLRKENNIFEDKDFRISLGKFLISLKDAKKNDTKILKKLFTLK